MCQLVLINVDDRDVINVYNQCEGAANGNDLFGQLKNELGSAFVVSKLDHATFRIKFSVTGTGSTVTTNMRIPFNFELLFIEQHHTDSTGADSTDQYDYTIDRIIESGRGLKILWVTTFASDIRDEFENMKYIACQLQMGVNTTNTDNVSIEIYLRSL